MASLKNTFLIELYEEHLEEASFLYEQRLSLLRNPEVSWRRIGEFEERLEAHLDGLVLGEELALEVCQRRAGGGDFGETHAAVRISCRHQRKDLLWNVLDELDGDAMRTKAVEDGLKDELPEAWQSGLLGLLESPHAHLVLIALGVIGYRRLPAGQVLLRFLDDPRQSVLAKAIWAVGRVRDRRAEAKIFSLLAHRTESIRSAAAFALLRLGSRDVKDYCLRRAASEPWAIVPSALSGGRDVSEALFSEAASGKPPRECMTGLGLLGYGAAIPILIGCLSNQETAAPAAAALCRVTGAHLHETVFVPEETAEESSASEWKEGESQKVSLRADGTPFGATVVRPLQRPEEWERWWKRRETSMDAGVRYRNGVAYSPESLIADLNEEATPIEARQLTCEELAIRYGCDVPMEADMFVSRQERSLPQFSKWARENAARFIVGASYFAGRLVDA